MGVGFEGRELDWEEDLRASRMLRLEGATREELPSKGESLSAIPLSLGGETHDIAEVVEGFLEPKSAPCTSKPAPVGELRSIFESCIVLALMSSSV